MSNSQSKILSFGAWFFGVTFISGALGAFLEGSLLSGVLMLIAGILLLPPVKRLISDKKPNFSKGKITAAGSILAVISLLLIPSDDETKNNDSKAETLTSDSATTEPKLDVVKPEPTAVKPKPITETAETKNHVTAISDEQAAINKIMEVGITLGVTPKEYGKSFNKLIKRAGLKETDWSDSGLDLGKQDYLDMFVIDYPSNVTLIGAVDKNGELKSLEYQVLTSAIDNTNAKTVALFLSFLSGASATVLSPELSEDEALQLTAKLIGDAATKFSKTEVSQRKVEIVGNKAYMIEVNRFMIAFKILPKASKEYLD